MLSSIKSILSNYDRIFIIPYDEAEAGICAEFMHSDEAKNTHLKLCFIVDREREIEDLYLTYQFSSKVVYLSGKTNYGNIFRYFQAGLLTKREIFRLLLE